MPYYTMRNMVKVRPRPKKPRAWRRTFIRKWREHRGLSQDRLIERLGADPDEPDQPFLTKASLSRIENGKQPYSQRILERLAEALNCDPADLLMRDPSQKDAPWDVYEAVRGLPPEKQADIAKMVKAIPEPAKTGTDD